MRLRVDAVRGRAGAKHAAASEHSAGPRKGAPCGRVGAQQGAALGRGMVLRWAYAGQRKGRNVVPRRGMACGCAGAQRGAAQRRGTRLR